MIRRTDQDQPILSTGYRRFRRQLTALRKHRLAEVVKLAAQARHELEHKRVMQAGLFSVATDSSL